MRIGPYDTGRVYCGDALELMRALPSAGHRSCSPAGLHPVRLGAAHVADPAGQGDSSGRSTHVVPDAAPNRGPEREEGA